VQEVGKIHLAHTETHPPTLFAGFMHGVHKVRT